MPNKSLKTLDKELKDLYRQLAVVQKQREARTREENDLTKRFKVGQLLRLQPIDKTSGVVVYKVIKVQKDRLITKQVWVSDTNIRVYPKTVSLMWYNAREAIKMNRKVVNAYLRNIRKVVDQAARELLES